MTNAFLAGANLSYANLAGANLSWTNMAQANLSYANLAGATVPFLSFAAFAAASILTGADLTGVIYSNPVPEPESYAVMLIGLGIIGSLVRRRRGAAV